MPRYLNHYIIVTGLVIIGLFSGFVYYESHRSTENIMWEDTSTPIESTKTPASETSVEISDISPAKNEEPNEVRAFINHDVPFTSQAPTGNWDDERQQDGCEEASALMAMLWVRNKTVTTKQAETEILAISDYEQATYGEYRDVSLKDVKQWIFNDYFKYNNVSVEMNITPTTIIKALNNGGVVLLPMNGQKLYNPYFTAPGPERHMLLVRGYDPAKKEFITNDPGTKRGENYRYSEVTIMGAILVYPTGYHESTDESLKGMIVIKK